MNQNIVLAPIFKRILARIFDLLIFVGFLVLVFWLLIGQWKDQFLLVNLALNGLGFCFFVFYFVLWPLYFQGQTLGKQIWSIKLIFPTTKKKTTIFWNLLAREFYIIFGPLILTWIFYGLYLLLFKVFLQQATDQLQFLTRASIIFLVWWIFLFLFIKIEPKHQLFYDRWLEILVVDMKASSKKAVMKKPANSDRKFTLPTTPEEVTPGIDQFLNTQQRDAVFANPNFNLRIIAGPGTGKTTVLINRIIFFLQELKVSPSRILTLTFTRKACQNIKDRVAKIPHLENPGTLPVFTYHAFCYWFLTVHQRKTVNVLDQTDQKQLIKSLLLKRDLSNSDVDKGLIREVTDVINSFQQNKVNSLQSFLTMSTTSEFLLALSKSNKEQIWYLYQDYIQYKQAEQLFDFVDLLVKTHDILTNDVNALNRLRRRYLYLAVDEFQDTNALQFDLIKLITDHGKKIKTTVVGDPDQTIYSWRGSKIDFIINFQRYFKSLNTVKLLKNYRSQQNIVTLANQIIAKNKKRIAKNIVAIKQPSQKVVLNLDDSAFASAYFIVYQIKTLLDKNVQANEIAILYRVNYLSGTVERLLLERNIPYHIYKGQEFFKRKEIKELLTLLRIVIEPRDLYWEAVLSWIKGIGPRTIAKIKTFATNEQKTIFEYLSSGIPFFLSQHQGSIQNFLDIFTQLRQQLPELKSLKILLKELFTKIYQPFLMNLIDYQQRLQNIEVLLEQIAVGFENNHPDLAISEKISEFLAQTQLSSADDLAKEEVQKIKLMTIHNAKGLEFDYVFIFDVSGNNFPNLQRKNLNFEEERRLFFVATTRARKGLFITGSDAEFSPFIEEVMKSPVIALR